MKPVVVFDFDGTIADTLDAVVQIANHLAEEFGYHPVDADEIKLLRNMSSRQVIQYAKIPLIKIPFLVRKVRTGLKSQIQDLKPVAGIPETLAQLQKQGCQLGIITSNSEENVLEFLNNHGIREVIHFIYSGVSLFGKGALMRRLLKDACMSPNQVVYVGDETRDIEAARRADIRAIAVAWGFNGREALASHHPDFLIDRPEELLSVIANLSLV